MNSDFNGYIPEKATQFVKDVQSQYNALHRTLIQGVQSDFVNAMKYAWICKDAVDFFNGAFTTAMNELVTDINTTFVSISEAVNSSCAEYANAGGGTWVRINIDTTAFPGYEINGTILEYGPNGEQGGSMTAADTAFTQLDKDYVDCQRIGETIVSLAKNSGFVGSNQVQVLESTLSIINQKIEAAFNDIKSKTRTAVSDAVNKFGQIASGTSSAYSAN